MQNGEFYSVENGRTSYSGEIKLQDLETGIPDEYIFPTVDANAMLHAKKIADKIQSEIKRLWISDKVIQDELRELNGKNIYSFVKYMITTSNSQSAIGDLKGHISSSCLRHIVVSMLRQAEYCELQESSNYKKLKRKYFSISKYSSSPFKQKADKKLMDETNDDLENLYLEMYKILH